MRVGMFTDSYFPQISGVATSIKILKEELEAQGHEVIIFTTTDPNADPDEEGVVRLTSIPFFSFKDRRIAIKGFSKALKEAKKYHIDIIHTHTEFSLGLAGKFIGYKLHIPTVHTYHTMYEKYLHYIAKGKVVRPHTVEVMSRMFCNQTSGVIVPGQHMKDKLSSYQVHKEIRVIPTGVEIPEIDPAVRQTMRTAIGVSENDIVLLSLSRLAFEKNIDAIVAAFPDVLREIPNAKLILVGDGPARSHLEEMVQQYNLTNVVRFVGEVNHSVVNQYYQMADLYVNASESETQGLTYLESIVNGCPVVAKHNDYLAEMIQSPFLGQLFHQDDEMSDTIIEMIKWMKQNDQQQHLDKKAELLKEISSSTFGKRVLLYYKHVIENYYFETEVEETQSFRNAFKLRLKINR